MSLAQFAVDRGGRKAGDVGNLADGFLLVFQVDELLQVFGFGEFVLGAEVVGFFDVVLEDELGVALDLLQAVKDDVVRVVLEGSCADFDLLDVAEEVVGKAVDDASVFLDVTHLELFGGQLAVNVEDFFFAGDIFGQLRAEDGFAGVGGGDDHGAFVLNNEAVEVRLGIVCGGGVGIAVGLSFKARWKGGVL